VTSGIELAFLALGTAALVLNLFALLEAVVDWRTLSEEKRNGLLRIAAKGSLYREIIRTAVQTLLLIVALFAAYTPEPPEPYRSSSGRFGAIIVFFVFQTFLVLGSINERIARHKMLDYDGSPQ
jgi:hypothetical protein